VSGVVLLTLAAFLQLAAYYLLKVVREPLVMMAGGAEVKRYAAAAQTAVLFGIVELYANAPTGGASPRERASRPGRGRRSRADALAGVCGLTARPHPPDASS